MQKWRDNVRAVVPYVPGEQPNQPRMIKLNTNENPYPPSPRVEEALWQMDAQKLRLYPDPAAAELTEALARRYEVAPEQVFVGVGSDDVLALSFLTFFNGGKPILFPDITYSFYDVWAGLYRIPYCTRPLDEEFRLAEADYFGENGGIVLANPNAPTGLAMPLEGIRRILDHNRDVIVIVDEAYIDFGGESAVSLIAEYDNLLVVQTFSKSRSMAGMRIGFCMGQPALIRYLNDVKYSVNSYTLNTAALALGVEAVRDEAYFRDCCRRIIQTREKAEEELTKRGFAFPKSYANFIFASHKTVPAREIFERLKENDIYVRWWNKDRIDNYLRITIGTDGQMEALYRALYEICG